MNLAQFAPPTALNALSTAVRCATFPEAYEPPRLVNYSRTLRTCRLVDIGLHYEPGQIVEVDDSQALAESLPATPTLLERAKAELKSWPLVTWAFVIANATGVIAAMVDVLVLRP